VGESEKFQESLSHATDFLIPQDDINAGIQHSQILKGKTDGSSIKNAEDHSIGEWEAGSVVNKISESLYASRLLSLLSLPAIDPREVQACDGNRKQLDGMENRTALGAL